MEENDQNNEDCKEQISEDTKPVDLGEQDDDRNDQITEMPEPARPQITIDYFSDSSESSEKCPICLLSFYDQEIGTPDMCYHAFCAKCIEEWAKLVKTCPIDRKAFTTINIYESYENRNFLRSVSVVKAFNHAPVPEPIIVVDVDRPGDKCEICHRADREDVMLLCDECDCGYHIDCLTPALREIPHGSWFCPSCPQVGSEDDEEVTDGLSIVEESYVEPVRKKSRQVTQITRTKQSELIRKTIMAILSRTKPGGRERRRKKRSRRSRPELRIPSEYDSALRLPVRPHRCGDNSDTAQNRSFFRERIPSLNLFGSSRELESVYDNDDENDNSSHSFESAPRSGIPIYASEPDAEVMSSQVACRRITGHHSVQNILKIKNIIRSTRTRPALKVTPTTAPPNLLDSIMESQQIWHSKDGMKDVIVAKGGNISLKRRTNDTNSVPSDGLDGPSSSTSAAALNTNHYQGNSSSNSGNRNSYTNNYMGSSSSSSHQYQPASSSSRNYSNLTTLSNSSSHNSNSSSSNNRQRPTKFNNLGLPPKKPLKDMFCDSDSEEEEEEEEEAASAEKTPPSRNVESFQNQEPESKMEEPSDEFAQMDFTHNDFVVEPPKATEPEPESYTPELQSFEAADENAVNAPQPSFTPQRPNEVISVPAEVPATTSPIRESLMANYNTSYPKEKPKNRRPRSKSKELGTKKNSDQRKKNTRRRSSSRSRSRRRSPRRRSKSSRSKSRSRSKNRFNRKKSRDKTKRRSSYSRSPVDRKKWPKRQKSRTRSKTPKSPVRGIPKRNRSRSRSRSANANNKFRGNWKHSSKRKYRSRSKSRSHDRKGRPWRKRGAGSRSPSASLRARPKTPNSPKATKKQSEPTTNKNDGDVDKFEYTKDPVAIIDLTNGIKEIIPSAKDIIIVSDSDHESDAPKEPTLVAVVEPEVPPPPDNSLFSELRATKLKTQVSEELVADLPSDGSKTSPVIPTTSPLKSCPTTPSAATTTFSPIAHIIQPLIAPQLPVELQKLLQTFENEKIKCLLPVLAPTPVAGISQFPVVEPVPVPAVAVASTGYDSPYSPGSSDFDDLADTSFNTTSETSLFQTSGSSSKVDHSFSKSEAETTKVKRNYDSLFGQSPNDNDDDDGGCDAFDGQGGSHKDDDTIFEEKKTRNFIDPRDKDKYLIKLSLQKRASDEAKEQLKPFYSTKQITKQEYKDILRSAVPKICRSREVNPSKIQQLIVAYVKKMQHQRKKK